MTESFFEGPSAQEGNYVCQITPKPLHEDPKAVQQVGQAVLKLLGSEGGRRGPVHLGDVLMSADPLKLLDLINGKDSYPVEIQFARLDYVPHQLAELLRGVFPREIVRDVTVDDQGIYGSSEGK